MGAHAFCFPDLGAACMCLDVMQVEKAFYQCMLEEMFCDIRDEDDFTEMQSIIQYEDGHHTDEDGFDLYMRGCFGYLGVFISPELLLASLKLVPDRFDFDDATHELQTRLPER